MRRIVFEIVSVKATKRWTDRSGKRHQETRQFLQTINPFNTDLQGNPKSREEIMREITAERDEWLKEPAARN